MVGYRNKRYEKFGKISAIVDDIANYIPSRITAVLIAILMGSKKALFNFYKCGKGHDSPNAGMSICAMALAIGVKLGGDTFYFGKLKKKPYFGDGKVEITKDDIKKALSFQIRLDIFIILFLGIISFIIKS
jgi:adenosylcobinamide-phosphate synthase